MDKRLKGEIGEDMAMGFYKNLGHKILYRNLRTYFGEIDLVTKFQNQIHLIEIKTHSRKDFGHPVENWNRKQKRRLKSSINYLIASGIITDPENLVCEFISFDISNLNNVRCKRYKNIPL